ncbi:MAG: ATP-binding cassette domain-containing protein [Actinobacteria bacterium]|nr:ATP-binding cassette domain-containing protein [Actinomycetota bacterium]
MGLVGVGVRYGRHEVLAGVSTTLAAGDVVHLGGPNGAGKSSLLRVIAGVQRPSTGQVTGRPQVVAWLPDRFPRRQPFTVRTYLLAQAAIRGLRPDAAARTVDAQVERFLLGDMTATRLRDLSKGSAQKVGLAQALLVPPELLLLDEPWSGLDATARTAVPEVVAEVAGRGGAVVLTDHHGFSGVVPTRRWGVTDGRLDELPTAGRTSPDGSGAPDGGSVVEVRVPDAAAAAALAADLGALGYDVAVRDGSPR